ncbi:MAG: hypothetical protein KDC38_15920 [Planctomycetes bacterium]|nr:hypothetical protein [Planctomycetota bacterium]
MSDPKTETKKKQDPRPGGPSIEEQELAFRVHTLSQLLFRHVVETHPWLPTMMGASVVPGVQNPIDTPTVPPWAATANFWNS